MSKQLGTKVDRTARNGGGRPHLAVDARMATDGGIGTYLQGTIPRIAAARPDWTITLLGNTAEMRHLGWSQYANVRLKECRAPIFSVQEQLEVPARCPRDADVYWAPYYNIPVLLRRPRIVLTIHDVCHIAFPELMGSAMRSRYARWLLNAARHKVERVLYDSEFTMRETTRLLGENGVNATVAYLGVDDDWRSVSETSRPIADPYFLYVGNIKRHKNVPLLLRAYRRVVERLPHRLVLIGRREGLRADPGVAEELAQLGDRVVILGEVDKQVVKTYVAHAESLVTTSLYEGFGLPPLEAMAAGCPCVVSRAGSLPEVCGDAALYCDPRDEASVAAQLIVIANDPALRTELVAKGRERARQFSWDRSAEIIVKELDRALS